MTDTGASAASPPRRPASRTAVNARFAALAGAVVLIHLADVDPLREPLLLLTSAGVTLRVVVALLRHRAPHRGRGGGSPAGWPS